jgi:hypothetical protein
MKCLPPPSQRHPEGGRDPVLRMSLGGRNALEAEIQTDPRPGGGLVRLIAPNVFEQTSKSLNGFWRSRTTSLLKRMYAKKTSGRRAEDVKNCSISTA